MQFMYGLRHIAGAGVWATQRLSGAALASFILAIALPHAENAAASEPPSNFTIAFIGDQSVSAGAVAVLELIRDEGADMVLHQGDLGYTSNALA
jgi:hypothetical protein